MRVLVADDEAAIRDSLRRYLEMDGAEATTAEDGLAARRCLQEQAFDAAIVDLKMPGQDGLELLRWIRAERPRLPVLMISAFGEVADAVTAMKLGAADYVVKPFDPEELLLRLGKLVEARALRDEAEAAGRVVPPADPDSDGPVTRSAAMIRIDEIVRQAAPTPATVLITGESGAGKEVIARSLHRHSGRDGPFVAVNSGGIPEALLESELFGHERGAFTGATERRIGMFELASSGTLFLDEIGEMPVSLQVKLLRAVSERRIRRLGGSAPVPVDARLIAATNRDLEEEVTAGRFREDLYYRLNVVRIRVPPLRERREDLALLVRTIVARLNQSMGRQVDGLTPAALGLLGAYEFPGNVRELENILERAVIFARGPTIDAGDLEIGPSGPKPTDETTPPAEPGTLKQHERRLIQEALARWQGNRTRAARELGISRRTLFNKIRDLHLDVE